MVCAPIPAVKYWRYIPTIHPRLYILYAASIFYSVNIGAFTSFPAKMLGPGSEREKYIVAAFVVPKSRLEPLF